MQTADTEETDEPKRNTGRTTALMYEAILKAIRSPGTWVEFQDHYQNQSSSHTESCAQRHAKCIEELCQRGRINATVEVFEGRARIKSHIAKQVVVTAAFKDGSGKLYESDCHTLWLADDDQNGYIKLAAEAIRKTLEHLKLNHNC